MADDPEKPHTVRYTLPPGSTRSDGDQVRTSVTGATPPLDQETVLSNRDLATYGYRTGSLRLDIATAIEQSEEAMAKPAPPSVNVQALADKAVLGVCEMLGLLFGLPFGEDLYRDKPFSEISVWHWLYLGIGIVFAGAGFMFPWIRTRTWIPERLSASLSRGALDARIWIVALLMIFLYGTAPEMYRRANTPAAPPTVIHASPTEGDIAAYLRTHPQTPSVTPLKLGPLKAITISKYLGNTPDRWAVFITSTPENRGFANLLIGLMRDRLTPWILDAPDSSTDLDAPKFPSAPTDPGITFRADNALNNQLSTILSPCFVVRKTNRQIDGLSEWFNSRLSEPERNENRKITWIEIGEGSPWRQGDLTQCLQ